MKATIYKGRFIVVKPKPTKDLSYATFFKKNNYWSVY